MLSRATGTAHSVLEFSDEKFIDENYDVYVAHGCIVLTNWTDGHNHLYLYKYNEEKTDSTSATLEKQLTKGRFRSWRSVSGSILIGRKLITLQTKARRWISRYGRWTLTASASN